MLRLILISFISMTATLVFAATDALPLKAVLGDAVTLEQKPRSAIVEYHPDTSTIRFELKGAKTLPVLHDFAYLTLLGADQSIVLSREERNAATARLPAILARWSGGCRESDQAGRIRCAIGKIAAKKRIERYFISHAQGGKCTVRESLDGKKEISKSQCAQE